MRTLLDAGLEVFNERGYQAARVDDIVKGARTSHGTFYLYFANKEDLFRVLAAECAEIITKLTEDLGPIRADDEGYAALRAWIAGFVDAYRRHGPVIRTWAEAQVDDREINELGMRAMDSVVAGLTRRIAESEGNADPGTAALALVAMVERLSYFIGSREIAHDTDELLDTLTQFAHLGIFGATRASA
jgi:AcrR family transcriptional regulator